MKTIIFATSNEGKIKEIRALLSDLSCRVLSMKEAGVDIKIEENGSTFEENAVIKAKAVLQAYLDNKTSDTEEFLPEEMLVALADDSGLEVDYLNKEPGIYSARYMGEDTSYEVKNQAILDRLKGVLDEQRTARFVCAIACVWPDGRTEVVRDTIEGRIGDRISGSNGFGYDPIFYVPEYGCTSAELSPEEKNRISHRAKAICRIKEYLR